MASDKGWIKLEKNIDAYELMGKNEPFDKTHAYIDMKMLCNYEDHPFSPFGGQTVITIHRGQFHTSIDKLATRWKWSKNKTVFFLNKLKKVGLIDVKSHNYGTTITLLKYDNFGNEGETVGKTIGTPNGKTVGKTVGSQYKNGKNAFKNHNNQRNQEDAGASVDGSGWDWGKPE